MPRYNTLYGNQDNANVVINTVTVTGSSANLGSVTVSGSTTITGSTSVVNVVSVTGSTAVVNTVTITGNTAVLNSVTVTGSTTLIKISLPSSSSVSVNLTGATTNLILIPSSATNSIYLTDLILSNGGAAGNIMFAHTNTATVGNVFVYPLYLAANQLETISLVNPIKITAVKDFVTTCVSNTTLTILATYFIAP